MSQLVQTSSGGGNLNETPQPQHQWMSPRIMEFTQQPSFAHEIPKVYQSMGSAGEEKHFKGMTSSSGTGSFAVGSVEGLHGKKINLQG